jgi:23S rRNA pseudouridine2605 synthase
MKERLQKLLARAGMGSRRQIEDWIREGRIQLNGKKAQLGDQADADDRITIDGHLLKEKDLQGSRLRVIMYNKPEGKVTTRSDPEGRPTIFEDIPNLKNGRWVTIGRLDINTSGLLLLTTDGELANRLMHPSHEIEREYAVRVIGEVTEEAITAMQQGVELEDGMAHFDRILDAGGQGANHWYHVTLREGRNREVRRLWESQGVKVSRLIRIRFANVELPKYLRTGHSKDLDPHVMQELLSQVGMEYKPESKQKQHARKNKPFSRRKKDSSPGRRKRPGK